MPRGPLLAEIERLSDSLYDACGLMPHVSRLLRRTEEFQQDLHQHIHLENNVLFPRAIVLEASAAKVVT